MVEELSEIGALELVLLILLVVGVLVVLYLLVQIVRSFLRKHGPRPAGELAVIEQAAEALQEPEPEPEPEEPLSEGDRLKKKEQELRTREERVKQERRKELEERERMVARKKTEYVAEEKDDVELGGDNVDMESERKTLQKFIRAAEDRYAKGELSDQNFRRIVSDYQQQLIELDVKMRKQRNDALDL